MNTGMINSGSTNHQRIYFLLLALVSFALYFKLGEQPLQMEEPRRAIVALEMDLSGNYIAPTIYGEYYYNKPPLWNWMILMGYKVFGGYTELAVRFFSVFSFLILGLLVFYFGKRYVGTAFGAVSSLFFLISGDILFHFSQLGEIDLFYSLLTFLSMISIFHFHQRKQYYLLFILCYLFAALGMLTKALPSLIFLGVSLLVFFIYKKEFRKLFSLAHLSGILLFVGLIGSYIFLYSRENDPNNLLNQLWSESSNRTTSSTNSLMDLVTHLFLFPLDMLKNLLPVSVMVIVLFQKKTITKIRSKPLIEFAFFMFLANVLLYLISTGARQRYIYMLYPLFIYILVFLYHENEKPVYRKIISVIFEIFLYLMSIGSVALIFIDELKDIDNLIFLSLAFFIVFIALLVLYRKIETGRLYFLIGGFILTRMLFNLVVYPDRSHPENVTVIEKHHAGKIAEITQGEELVLYKNTFLFYRLGFYIEANRKAIMYRKHHIKADVNYLIKEKRLENMDIQYIYRFEDKNKEKYAVVKFNE